MAAGDCVPAANVSGKQEIQDQSGGDYAERVYGKVLRAHKEAAFSFGPLQWLKASRPAPSLLCPGSLDGQLADSADDTQPLEI